MRDFGWEPVILTVENGAYQALDPTLENEIPNNIHIYKTKAFQPFDIYKKLTGQKQAIENPFSKKDKTIIENLAKWIRLNLFIPDARIGWYKYAVKAAQKIIKDEQIDIIYSSSPPHSLQLIAKKIAKRNSIKWVADFRDPWSELVHYQNNKRSWLTKKIDHRFEKSVFRNADHIIAAANNYAQCIKSHVNREISIIYNGYDPSDFSEKKNTLRDYLKITYTGELSKDRIPYNLLRVISRLKIQKLQLQFIGNSCPELYDIIRELNISDKVFIRQYLPHTDAIAELQDSDILLLVINQVSDGRGIVPGKLFEYMGIHKPILCIGDPEGESAQLIKETHSGYCINHEDEESISTLLSEINNKVTQNLSFQVKTFERRYETQQLCEIFNSLLNHSSNKAMNK